LKKRRSRKDEEGCLSVPGVYGMVERPTEIVITYLDLNGKRHEEVVSGLKPESSSTKPTISTALFLPIISTT